MRHHLNLPMRIKNIVRCSCICLLLAWPLATAAYANQSQNWQNYQQKATTQFEAGQYSQAMQNAKQALSIAEKGQGQTAPYKGSSLNIMAMIADAQGDHTQAISYMQRAIKLFEQSTGAHLNTATLIYNLAGFYQKQQQTTLAINSLKQADEMLQQLRAKQSNSDLNQLQSKVLNDLQLVFSRDGQHQQAAVYAERQYQLLSNASVQSLSPEQNLSVVRAMLVLLQNYQQQGQTEHAQKVLDEIFSRFAAIKPALKIERWQADYAYALELKVRGAAHGAARRDAHLEAIDYYQQLPISSQANFTAQLANHYNELGFWEFEQKKHQEAEGWFKKSQPLMQQAFGVHSLEYGSLLNNFALVKEQLAEHQQALDYHQQVQQIFDGVFAKDPSLASSKQLKQAYSQSLNNSGVIQYKLREYKAADVMWQKGLSLFDLQDAEQAQLALPILENMHRAYLQQSRKKEAKEIKDQIDSIKREQKQG